MLLLFIQSQRPKLASGGIIAIPKGLILDTLPVGKKKRGIEGYWVNHAQASKQAKCVLCYD